MSTLDECFVKALKSFVEKEKSQRAFALKYDVVTPVYLNKILLGKKYGSDETKRALASALGYPGAKYEDFLNIGRRALGLSVTKAQSPPAPEVAGYLDKARAIIEGGGERAETLKNMIKIMEG